jgi:hypothetical protein
MVTELKGEAEKPAIASGQKHRNEPRFDCNGFAEVVNIQTHLLFRGEIQDISETGCFINTAFRLKLEHPETVDVRFTLNNVQYHLLAQVVQVKPGRGVGLEFLFDDPLVKESIKDLVQAIAFAKSTRYPERTGPLYVRAVNAR